MGKGPPMFVIFSSVLLFHCLHVYHMYNLGDVYTNEHDSWIPSLVEEMSCGPTLLDTKSSKIKIDHVKNEWKVTWNLRCYEMNIVWWTLKFCNKTTQIVFSLIKDGSNHLGLKFRSHTHSHKNWVFIKMSQSKFTLHDVMCPRPLTMI
jgi:hypothetical protein